MNLSNEELTIIHMCEIIASCGGKFGMRKVNENVFETDRIFPTGKGSYDVCAFTIDFSKKKLTRYTAMESRHNGSEYDCKEITLDWSLVVGARHQFTSIAREAAFYNEELERKKREQEALEERKDAALIRAIESRLLGD